MREIYEQALDACDRLQHMARETRAVYEERSELVAALLLAETLEVIVADADRRIRDEHEADADDLGEQITAKTAAYLNQAVGICLGVLKSSPGRKFDAFVPPFRRLAQRVTGGNTELLVSPTSPAREYQISQPLNDRLLKPAEGEEDLMGPALKERINSLPNLVILSYPESAEDDSFSHCLIGHEIAHLVLRAERRGDEMARLAFQDFAASQDGPIEGADALLVDRATRWFMELACDRVGLRLIGPGLYFALFEFALLRSWQYEPNPSPHAPYNEYPALAWRLNELAPLVEGYLPNAHSRRGKRQPWPAIRRIFEQTRARVPTWTQGHVENEKAIVNVGLGLLREVELALLPAEDPEALVREVTVPTLELAERFAQHGHYAPAQFQDDLEVVWQKISAQIVPAERVLHRAHRRLKLGSSPGWPGEGPWSLPIDWRSILNGAYLHWMVSTQDATPEQRLAERRRNSTLARGGVELSEIHRTALALRQELSVLAVEDG